MTLFAFGAFGTNNVGDEAILAGMRRKLGPVREIYVNRSESPDAIWYADILGGQVPFARGDTLVIGGGGILHGPDAIGDYRRVAEAAVAAGATVEIRGVGAEGLSDASAEALRPLCRIATRITARSTRSVNLLAPVAGREVVLERDFALSLPAAEVGPAPDLGLSPEACVIGLVTGGSGNLETYRPLIEVLKTLTIGPTPVTFVHIPHHRSFVAPADNDEITGTFLWSSIEVYHADRSRHFRTLPFDPDPMRVLALYRALDGVISYRYHGMLFSETMGRPLLLAAPNAKNLSYVEDAGRSDVSVQEMAGDADAILAGVKSFVAVARSTRRGAEHRQRAAMIGSGAGAHLSPSASVGWRDRLAALPRLTTRGHAMPCPVCNGTAQPFCSVDFLRVCSSKTPYAFGFSNVPVHYMRCTSCDFLWTPAMHEWSREDFARFVYNDDYLAVDPDYVEARPLRIASTLARLLDGVGPLRILDYGSGSGATGRAMEARGIPSVTNYDPFSHPQKPEGRFDLVMAFEVIEHSPDPLGTFDEMRSLLADEGAILVGVAAQPDNIATLGAGWWYLGPRNGHVSTYSAKTLWTIAKRIGLKLHAGDGLFAFTAEGSPAIATLLERIGRQRSSLRLFAPGPGDQSKAWHGVESTPLGPFRWTATDCVAWQGVWLNQGRIGVRIPVRMQIRPGIADGCHLFVGGRGVTMTFDGDALLAEMIVPEAGVQDVELRTPPLSVPAELHGVPDTRHLGLAIACAPEN